MDMYLIKKIRTIFTFENCDLTIYSKETEMIEYLIVAFFTTPDFLLDRILVLLRQKYIKKGIFFFKYMFFGV